jgi:hypothetical protein
MSSIPGIEEITHEGLDFETFSMEDLDKILPCDVKKKKCKSRHTEPATWLGSHVGGESTCTVLMCEPCIVNLQQWIAHCCVHHGLYGFGCRLCGAMNMKYTQIITRPL